MVVSRWSKGQAHLVREGLLCSSHKGQLGEGFLCALGCAGVAAVHHVQLFQAGLMRAAQGGVLQLQGRQLRRALL